MFQNLTATTRRIYILEIFDGELQNAFFDGELQISTRMPDLRWLVRHHQGMQIMEQLSPYSRVISYQALWIYNQTRNPLTLAECLVMAIQSYA